MIHHHFPVLDSTNTWAKKNAHLFSREALTLITADEQTAGRGQFNRKWVSPPSQNIYASFCFFLDERKPWIENIPQVMAISVCQALETWNFKPKIKWPNDIQISGKKVGGVLCETTPIDDQIFVIVGLGLNVNMTAEALKTIGQPATSLFLENGKNYPKEELMQMISQEFSSNLNSLLNSGFQFFNEIFQYYLLSN